MNSTKRMYKGPRDLDSLQIAGEWAPNAYLPQPTPLAGAFFPSKSMPYVDLVERLSVSGHTELRYLRNELRRAQGTSHAERSRASVLELSTERPVHKPFHNSIDLENYLSRSVQGPQNRLYVLEDISTNYVEAFSLHFSIEPSFWARHLRTTNWETSTTAGKVTPLPSMNKGGHVWSLVYLEATYLEGPSFGKFHCPTALFADTNLYRQVNMIQPGRFYDALILVDPPIGANIYVHNAMGSSPIPLSIDVQWPYQGGYTDFNTLNYKTTTSYNDPPRTSLYDDLIYYHLQDQAIRPTKVEEAPLLLKRILAGHWMTSVAYIETSVSILEIAVAQSRENNSDDGASTPPYRGLKWLEEQLFHIYGWKRKVSRYLDWSACNLLELNISEADYVDLESEEKDWVFIKYRLDLYEKRSRDVVSSAVGLLSLVESHKSVEEAESARIIAILGTIYLPISLTAGILSMGGNFIPGAGKFWVFPVVAVPLTLLSCFLVAMANTIKAAPKLDYVDVDGGFPRGRVPWDDEDMEMAAAALPTKRGKGLALVSQSVVYLASVMTAVLILVYTLYAVAQIA
ncbi:hypothetical protein V500_10459 [Pseudogymnoascus sp. VKM F-4518 (FW-2643)]|nr:hypothetical protein V500_10459 [Pseudogymnoascus sp. VKM F-4518 (FW-2643)]